MLLRRCLLLWHAHVLVLFFFLHVKVGGGVKRYDFLIVRPKAMHENLKVRDACIHTNVYLVKVGMLHVLLCNIHACIQIACMDTHMYLEPYVWCMDPSLVHASPRGMYGCMYYMMTYMGTSIMKACMKLGS